MTYRIRTAIKKLRAAAAVRAMPMNEATYTEPQPRMRRFSDDPPRTFGLDDWLFDAPTETFSNAVASISSELQRTSETLSQLRGLLDEVARVEPVQVWRRPDDFGLGALLAGDALLFEGEAVASIAVDHRELDGEASFLFEEDGTLQTWAPASTDRNSAYAA